MPALTEDQIEIAAKALTEADGTRRWDDSPEIVRRTMRGIVSGLSRFGDAAKMTWPQFLAWMKNPMRHGMP